MGANLESHKYGALRLISYLLVAAGWLEVIAGFLLALLGTADIANMNQTFGHQSFDSAFGITKLTAGITLLVTGIIVIAMGQIIQLFIDIAQQTTLTAENSAKTVAFFERVNSRVSPGSPISADKPPTNAAQAETRAKTIKDEGIDVRRRKWRIYDDGSIDLQTSKGLRTFSNYSEYSKFSMLGSD